MTDIDYVPSPFLVDLPVGRVSRWQFSLHKRTFAPYTWGLPSRITDLVDIRSRRVEFALNAPTLVSFAVAGQSATATEILELGHDVIAWRWDDRTGRDVPMTRCTVLSSQDTLSEQVHTVSYTCQDGLALLKRRFLTAPYTVANWEQDTVVQRLLDQAQGPVAAGGNLYPASELSIGAARLAPDGGTRPVTGVLRTRNYDAQQNIYEAIDNLAHVINGFDYDMDYRNTLRVWFPERGVLNTGFTLEYGVNVASLTRSLSSTRFANYVRTIGKTPDGAPAGTPPPAAEAWAADTNDLVANPSGLWMQAESATDVSVQATLDEKVQGTLAAMAAKVNEGPRGLRVPLPNYSLQLRPGAYWAGAVDLGDTVPLVIRSGRLRVNTLVRVVGLTFVIGDDGQEDIEMVVGTPAQRFVDVLTAATARVSALERRT